MCIDAGPHMSENALFSTFACQRSDLIRIIYC